MFCAMLIGAMVAAEPVPDAAIRSHAYDVLLRRMDHYVDPAVAVRVRARLKADRTHILAQPDNTAFMKAVDADLYAASHDRHLSLGMDADTQIPGPQPPRTFGVEAVERLRPDIALLRMSGFYGDPASVPAIDAALERLRGVRVLILDLRENGGGGQASMLRLLGHAFPVRTELNGIAWRTCLPRPDLPPDACVQGPPRLEREFTDTPPDPAASRARIYVLVSRRTFSAAEAVAYELQEHHRAVIVGETTGGGGNPSAAMDLESRFFVIMPIGRLHRVTSGHGWEGVGVRPDVRTSASGALDAALISAEAADNARSHVGKDSTAPKADLGSLSDSRPSYRLPDPCFRATHSRRGAARPDTPQDARFSDGRRDPLK